MGWLMIWVGIGLVRWLLGGGWIGGDRVGVGDAEDLCGGEADGLGVGWEGWLLCGDVFKGAEGRG